MNTQREDFDFYPTPRSASEGMCPLLAAIPQATVLDLCAGRGNLAAFWQTHRSADTIDVVDVQSHLVDATQTLPGVRYRMCADVRDPAWQRLALANAYTVIISNPPYRDAEAMLDVALSLTAATRGRVLMLLRLSFLGSQQRHDK